MPPVPIPTGERGRYHCDCAQTHLHSGRKNMPGVQGAPPLNLCNEDIVQVFLLVNQFHRIRPDQVFP